MERKGGLAVVRGEACHGLWPVSGKADGLARDGALRDTLELLDLDYGPVGYDLGDDGTFNEAELG